MVDANQRVDLGGGRHVAQHALDPAQPQRGQFVGRLPQPSFVVVGDHHVGTLGQGAPRGRRTDAGARGGGHHHHLAFQKSVSGNLFRRFGQTHPLTSLGKPSTRSAMMLRWISLDPP